jgi:hypothetical protein
MAGDKSGLRRAERLAEVTAAFIDAKSSRPKVHLAARAAAPVGTAPVSSEIPIFVVLPLEGPGTIDKIPAVTDAGLTYLTIKPESGYLRFNRVGTSSEFVHERYSIVLSSIPKTVTPGITLGGDIREHTYPVVDCSFTAVDFPGRPSCPGRTQADTGYCAMVPGAPVESYCVEQGKACVYGGSGGTIDRGACVTPGLGW